MGLISDDSRERIPELSTGDRVPLHPALTDLPVATLSLAPVFDAIALITGSQNAGAAGLWTGTTALVSALPTAATGTLDYLRARSGSPVKRIGLAHAALNTFALAMMTGSLISRRFRSAPTPLSLVFSAAAGAAATYSSHLGGIMVYREGMRVSGEGLQAIGRTEPRSSGTEGLTPLGPTEEATTGLVSTPIDEWATGGAAQSSIAVEVDPLGTGGRDASTIGGVQQDSPDTQDMGLLVQSSGRERWDELDRLESAVEEGTDSPDDFTLEEGDLERPDEETGGASHAA